MRHTMKRGALIIFEGCDRSGKSTQCQRLVKHLSESLPLIANDQPAAKLMRFPDRDTQVGKLIDAYLQGKSSLDDHIIHLLFSANRWEKADDMKKSLEAGQNVIVDRYAYSGIAFSAAKDGMSLEWCRQPDRGLPKPDLVCFLDVSPEEASKRGGFGNEVYETKAFQARVRTNYDKLIENDWKIINTDSKSMDEVFAEVTDAVKDILTKPEKGPILPLWPLELN